MGAVIADVERLWVLLGRQQGAIDSLKDEVIVLRSCLEDVGALTRDKFLAVLHRWRCVHIQQKYPCSATASLRQFLNYDGLALAVAQQIGPGGLQAFRTASQSTHQAIDRLLPSGSVLFPLSICVCGGNDGAQRLNSAERFCPQAGRWEPLPPMLERRSSVAAAVVSGRLFVCGGSNGLRILSSTERFDVTVQTWEPMTPMLDRRERAVAAAINSRLYVCGGFDGRQRLSSSECYNAKENSWRILPPTLEPRSQAAAAVLSGGLYVCGGYDGVTILSSVERFDPSTEIWEPMPPISQRRSQAAAVVLGRRLYVCGGYNGTERLNSVECFDPEACCWQPTEPTSEPRSRAAAAAVGGTLFVFGGFNGAQRLSSAERFNPETGSWHAIAAMTCQREGAAAVSIWWPSSSKDRANGIKTACGIKDVSMEVDEDVPLHGGTSQALALACKSSIEIARKRFEPAPTASLPLRIDALRGRHRGVASSSGRRTSLAPLPTPPYSSEDAHLTGWL